MGNQKDSPLNSNLLIDFPEVGDGRGILTVIDQQDQFDWSIKRLFFIRDVSDGVTRGQHAHKSLQQIIIAAAGSFRVKLFDGKVWKTFALSTPSRGIRIPKMIWVELTDFSDGAAALVIADRPYDENDYIRDLVTYLDMVG
ncbi:MAG: FdtA/QdtA family cupin domain-containing protein [Anaerolineae bacterium]|nr:FdtA/QdtA family cupin domain-containing protein [Anaerolineae bacterium]